MVLATLVLAACAGVPGPDSTAVVAAASDRESVALAERYARARGIPDVQVCAVDAPLTEDVSLADLRARIVAGIDHCLGEARDRIEALVLARGMPLRVVIGGTRVSVAAALALGDTATSTGAPLLGRPPGRLVNCGGGNQCLAARWINPFRSGVFRPGWTTRQNGFVWRPRIVTMLHGRSAADAARLIASATTADALGGARGTFLFMDGADPARGVLDGTYDATLQSLRDLGFTDVERVPFANDLTGRALAAFFTGTAGLGATIEGNTFRPGAIVDNLTSFGAVAENFRASGESQVSIARWVARGVAGVHGTTDEPLNDCFPARSLAVAYAEGGTLGEAYFRALPYMYWQNLVLGDPMTAPYATRPRVIVDGLADGDTFAGSRRLEVRAEDALGRTIDALVLYIDGVERARSGGDPIAWCLASGDRHVLAVAQLADERTLATRHRAKGWASLRVTGTAGPAGCPPAPAVDAGLALDSGADDTGGAPEDAAPTPSVDAAVALDAAAPISPENEGCSCTTTPPDGALSALFAIAVLIARPRGRRVTRDTVVTRTARQA